MSRERCPCYALVALLDHRQPLASWRDRWTLQDAWDAATVPQAMTALLRRGCWPAWLRVLAELERRGATHPGTDRVRLFAWYEDHGPALIRCVCPRPPPVARLVAMVRS